jgi:hypothetical protein
MYYARWLSTALTYLPSCHLSGHPPSNMSMAGTTPYSQKTTPANIFTYLQHLRDWAKDLDTGCNISTTYHHRLPRLQVDVPDFQHAMLGKQHGASSPAKMSTPMDSCLPHGDTPGPDISSSTPLLERLSTPVDSCLPHDDTSRPDISSTPPLERLSTPVDSCPPHDDTSRPDIPSSTSLLERLSTPPDPNIPHGDTSSPGRSSEPTLLERLSAPVVSRAGSPGNLTIPQKIPPGVMDGVSESNL